MSTLASKLRLPAGRPAAVINPPEGYVEQLAIDDHWTALRFRRGA